MGSRGLSENSSSESIVNRIRDRPAATAEESPVDDHRQYWRNFDKAFEMPIGGPDKLTLLEDIDPQGLYKPLVRQYLGPQAPEPIVIPQPVVIPVRSQIDLRYEAEFARLELALAEFLLAQAIEEGTDRALQQDISAPGIDMNTATLAPFIISMSENVTDVAPTAPIEISISNLLLASALEPVRSQEPAGSSSSGSSQQQD